MAQREEQLDDTAQSNDVERLDEVTPAQGGDVALDPALADIPELGYEQARDELIAIVARLEGGQAPLEESMTLWHRGEALAAHCAQWLDAAQTRIEQRPV
jgi:exodeoxyribonuclease VII small subunit